MLPLPFINRGTEKSSNLVKVTQQVDLLVKCILILLHRITGSREDRAYSFFLDEKMDTQKRKTQA